MMDATEGCCDVCGSKLTEIRGRYPNEPRRKVCATCLKEKLEQIEQILSSGYGQACVAEPLREHKKLSIEQLEKMVDTHNILPNGDVVLKG